MNMRKRNALGLLTLAGFSVALAGCTRTSVAVNANPAESRKTETPAVARTGRTADPVATMKTIETRPAPSSVSKVSDAPAKIETKATTVAVAPPVREVAAPPVPVVADDGKPFQFPADKGGKVLANLLKPEDRLASPLHDLPPGPLTQAPPSAIGHPSVPLPGTPAGSVSPPAPKAPALRPHMLPEGAPFSAYQRDPSTPAQREFATGVTIGLPSRDVARPVSLGYLGLPSLDRIPLEEPTAEASLASALAAAPPERTTPIPFTPLNLPDPFANAQTVKLRTPPAEETSPLASQPRLPPAPTTQPQAKQ